MAFTVFSRVRVRVRVRDGGGERRDAEKEGETKIMSLACGSPSVCEVALRQVQDLQGGPVWVWEQGA